MNEKNYFAFAGLIFTLLLGACAGPKTLEAPDTLPGDQIKGEYMVGRWCTDRELTAQSNRDAGHSGLLNLSSLFWSFKQDGTWQVSSSGWLYEDHGKWRIRGLDTLVLEQSEGEPGNFQASFKESSLYLTDEEGKFLVLSVCN